MKKVTTLWISLALLLLLAACSLSGAAEPEAADTMADKTEAVMEEKEEEMAEAPMEEATAVAPADAAMAENAPTEEAMMEEKEGEAEMVEEVNDDLAMMEKPVWQTIALTDARTGESFTLADFAGKTVFVEPMATWCGNCRQQLGNVAEARSQLADENTVFIGLSVETNISDQELADYSEQTGFDWTFAVATPELLQALAATFGQSITNPPSTPHFIVRPDGSYTDLVTGIESPEELMSQLQGAGG